ncbi:MAG: DUF3021 domain-containing protein [Clostridia bacterium]|nr:DUF3021 domain-containing protein [Clostridia bacterium]
MNVYLKKFLLRGLVFGGFGPIILGIIYAILQSTVADFSLTGGEVLLGIISTYILAFVQAGASVFNQIEEWPIAKSLLCHFSLIYLAYSLCYILNTWIPFVPKILAIFTAIFVVAYFVIWFTVVICTKIASDKFNAKLNTKG